MDAMTYAQNLAHLKYCCWALPEALRVNLPGAHELLRGLEAARVQAAEDLRCARQPRVLVQEPQGIVVHIAALRRP